MHCVLGADLKKREPWGPGGPLSETRPDTHGSYVTCMPIKSTEMSIAGTKKKTSMLIFFGRLGIEEPEHLRMR